MIVYENDEDFEQALDEYLQSSELDERHDVIEQELEKICVQTKAECERLGIKYSFEYGKIIMDTGYSLWYFEPRLGKTRLMHKNTKNISAKGGNIHEQFRKQITPPEIVKYIYLHDMKLYKGFGKNLFDMLQKNEQINDKK